ncbi:3-methyl-2-oxobutanoate hydroxymethyltransferase [Kribbella sp. NPDC055071]
MVDNFLSAGTPGDDEELPSPYGTGPKNRTTEEHRRSDYGDDNWRDSGLGLDPSPSLPNAPRSYERGPVPQQPYVPKPPYLPAAPPPPPQQPQQRYGDQPQGRSEYYGDREQPREPGREPTREPGRESIRESGREQFRGEREQFRSDQEQNPFRPQQPPPQGRPSPFGPGSNGTPPRPQAQIQQPLNQQPPRPPAPPQSSNGVAQRPAAPQSSNGSTNWPPAQSNGHSNGLSHPSSNGLSNGTSQQAPIPQPQTPPPAPQPAQNQPAQNQPAQPKAAPSLPAQNQSAQNQSAHNQPAQNSQSAQNQSALIQAAQNRASHNQAPQNQTAQNQAPQNQAPPNQVPPSHVPPGQPQQQQPQQLRPPAPPAPPAYPVENPTITPYMPEALESHQREPKQDGVYLSDPSAEYDSGEYNGPVDAPGNAPANAPANVANEPRRVGARRRADVQQDAPPQVSTTEHASSHRAARRAQATASTEPSEFAGSSTPAENRPAGGSAGAGGGPSEGSKRPRRYRVHHLRDMKNRGEKWAMLTAYDQYTAEIFDQAGIPVLLIGDSAANNVFGYDTTLRVTVDELIPLARAVAGAVDRALVVADLPFGSYQASPEQAFHTAVRFMKEAGVHAVKLEGGRTVVPMVEKLTQSGIPVMAHIGFTPQSEHSIGGYRVQGRGDQAAGLIDDAVALAEAGAFSVVLEMVPGDVAAEITKRISIPTIGIGAGRDTDAQVLVWQDMAGLRSGTMPRFVKQYADLRGILTSAATSYAADVATGSFPADEHTF